MLTAPSHIRLHSKACLAYIPCATDNSAGFRVCVCFWVCCCWAESPYHLQLKLIDKGLQGHSTFSSCLHCGAVPVYEEAA